jgi:SAM-dependent methyltransferase
MMTNPDLGPVAKLYEDSLSQHGLSSKGVGWPDDASHRQRFIKLATVIDVSRGPVTINDLGCGYGAFWNYLSETGVPVRHFRGYDISERMVAHARELVPSGEFLVGDKLTMRAEYSFACGIFNVRLDRSEEDWRSHIENTLDNLNDCSSHGFAFNLLSTYVDFRQPHLFYGDPLHFFHLCKTRYSKRVALLHDYPLYEWTIAVAK